MKDNKIKEDILIRVKNEVAKDIFGSITNYDKLNDYSKSLLIDKVAEKYRTECNKIDLPDDHEIDETYPVTILNGSKELHGNYFKREGAKDMRDHFIELIKEK